MPLLVAMLRRMGVPGVLDQAIVAHGNRGGLSVGWLATAWLAYIVSEADHRRNQVELWAARRRRA